MRTRLLHTIDRTEYVASRTAEQKSNFSVTDDCIVMKTLRRMLLLLLLLLQQQHLGRLFQSSLLTYGFHASSAAEDWLRWRRRRAVDSLQTRRHAATAAVASDALNGDV